MRVGYARVSTADQKLDLQMDALKAAGCEQIYSDVASGAKEDRPELAQAIAFLRKGDTLVCWKLDRAARTLSHLVKVISDLNARGIHFISLNESIDTSSAAGKLIFHIFGSLAEFERELIRERTKAGLVAARARGKVGGRPKRLSDAQIEKVIKLMSDRTVPISDICAMYSVSRSVLYAEYKKRKSEKAPKGSGKEKPAHLEP